MQISEEDRLERRIVSRFRKAISYFHLVDDGDRVLVALSGGKDSLCLLDLLARQSQVYRPKFYIEAVHVRMENIQYESDTTYLEDFCHQRGVKLHILTTRFETDGHSINNGGQTESTLQADYRPSTKLIRKQKTPCFLCSWYRRKKILNLAQAEGFNKIALGHHQDDIIHTTLMNLFFQGRFEGMPANLHMNKMPLTIIRPLCLEHECDLRAFANLHRYQKQHKNCPHEHNTHRADIAHFYQQVEHMNAEARNSIWHALQIAGKLIEY